MAPQRFRNTQCRNHIPTMSQSTEDLPVGLREWAEMLARHHRSLRRPLATDRPLPDADQLGDDGQEQDGGADREQQKPASQI